MLIFLFLGSIAAANVAVTYLDPVPVGFGLYAPAGVYLVAVTLVARDLVHRFHGRWGLVGAGVAGLGLSYWLADPRIVTASLAAFAASFAVDTAAYVAVRRWVTTRLSVAALVSGLVSIVPDTFIFLWLAGLLQYWPGQLVGKATGTVVAALVLVWLDRAIEAQAQFARRR